MLHEQPILTACTNGGIWTSDSVLINEALALITTLMNYNVNSKITSNFGCFVPSKKSGSEIREMHGRSVATSFLTT